MGDMRLIDIAARGADDVAPGWGDIVRKHHEAKVAAGGILARIENGYDDWQAMEWIKLHYRMPSGEDVTVRLWPMDDLVEA